MNAKTLIPFAAGAVVATVMMLFGAYSDQEDTRNCIPHSKGLYYCHSIDDVVDVSGVYSRDQRAFAEYTVNKRLQERKPQRHPCNRGTMFDRIDCRMGLE